MRNIGSRVNENNVIEIIGGYEGEEYEVCTRALYRALEISSSNGLTPSEERILSGFEQWYLAVDPVHPYHTKNPAYVYMNVNTGVSLLFLIRVPYEGCRGGKFRMDGIPACLVPAKFD